MSVPSSLAAGEFVGILRFPLWWYGAGFAGVRHWLAEDLRLEWRRLGIRLWMRDWFRPMYGVSDLAGRIISVVMRTALIVVRFLWWAARAFVYGLALAAWLAWPPLAVSLLLFPLLW